MSDDQDECEWEWLSVSSGTGLPGLSETKGHYTVVCVCKITKMNQPLNILFHSLWPSVL